MIKINLTKLIADNSNYSRRQAEKLIRDEKVKINDRPATLGEKVNPNIEVFINNKKIKRNEEKIYIKLNKPCGYVCTNKVFKNEKNIFSLVKNKTTQKLFSLGRLDKNSCGLIILTNDGNLTYQLTHPKFEHKKIYIIKLKNDIRLKETSFINKLTNEFKKGIDINEKTPAKMKEIRQIKDREFEITLIEGKKRQIRKMFKYFELEVEFLKRINFAGITLGNLKEGQWIDLNEQEIIGLRRGGRVV
ncbi:MAG: pseudouridine synthase [Bacilli bacterium]